MEFQFLTQQMQVLNFLSKSSANICVSDHWMFGNWGLDVSRIISSAKENMKIPSYSQRSWAHSATTMVSFPRRDSFASHIIPYNREHATVGLNASTPWRFYYCVQNHFIFLRIATGRGVPYDHEQARGWPWNHFLFSERVNPASSQANLTSKCICLKLQNVFVLNYKMYLF